MAKGWHGDSAGHARAARKRGWLKRMTTRTVSIKAKRAKRNKLAKKRARYK